MGIDAATFRGREPVLVMDICLPSISIPALCRPKRAIPQLISSATFLVWRNHNKEGHYDHSTPLFNLSRS